MPRRKGQPAGGAWFAVEEPLRPRLELAVLPLAICRQLFVADDPVRPEIRDLDDQLVSARLRGGGDVHVERRFPEHAKVLTV